MMRFYRREDEPVLEIRNPRVWFFLLGPFHLLWLRLWQDALVMGVVIWACVHGVLLAARDATGVADGLDLAAAYAAIDSVRAGAAAGVPADSAFRHLMAMLIPYYAAGAALVAIMAMLTPLLPRYLAWRLGHRGWQLLPAEARREDSPPALRE